MGETTRIDNPQPAQRCWVGPLVVALLSFFAVVSTLDPDDCLSYSTRGPGITVDESFNVQQGVYLFDSVKRYGIGVLDPESLREIFAKYLPDHPPLGRLWLGVWHAFAQWIAPGDVAGYFVTGSARWGSAAAFACTIFIVGIFTARRFGQTSGVVAAISLLLMPRLFAHAHLAALESITNLVWSAAVLSVAYWWTAPADAKEAVAHNGVGTDEIAAPSNRTAAWTGVVLGLALLTKIQAIIIPPLVVCWAVWHWRSRAMRPLAIWAATGFAVFCLGWPYLWFDFTTRLTEYFASSSDRAVVNVWYLGERLDDTAAPWHYPWVMFFSTIPVGLLACGLWAMYRKRKALIASPMVGLIFGAVVAPLVLFSIPGVAVYDGTRLFLVSFPVFCVFVGVGFAALLRRLQERTKRGSIIAWSCLACQAIGLLWMHPFQLSYHNGLVGGTAGAASLGFEPTFWGDSINAEIIDQIPVGDTTEILVAPQLHQFQIDVLKTQCPRLGARRVVKLDPLDARADQSQVLLLFHRQANAPSIDQLTQSGWKKVSTCSRQGVELASIWIRG